MEDAEIKRHLTGLRCRVLDVIADGQVAGADDIAAVIADSAGDVRPRHRNALPRMVADVLWRLERLDWIERTPRGPRVTALGDRARKIAQRDA